jgi:hypothetical protein
MEALGRLVNIIPIASAKPFRLRGASTAMVVVTGATAVATLNQDSSFAGGFASTLAAIRVVYWSTATDGTAPWSKLIISPAVSTYTHGTTAGLLTAAMSCFHVFTSELADPNSYLKVTAGGSGLCSVITADLTVQRAPANLELLGA